MLPGSVLRDAYLYDEGVGLTVLTLVPVVTSRAAKPLASSGLAPVSKKMEMAGLTFYVDIRDLPVEGIVRGVCLPGNLQGFLAAGVYSN